MNFRLLVCAASLAGSAVAGVQPARLTVTGSDTMLVLNQRLAAAYGAKTGVAVEVQGGGTKVGVENLAAGFTQIAAASRELTKAEIDALRDRGALAVDMPVGMDGLAIVVNAKNPVATLSLDQIAGIYSGRIRNWALVGGRNEAIVPYGRNDSSGSAAFFQSTVMRNAPWAQSLRVLPSTAEISAQVGRTTGGIGYGGVAYFRDRKDVKVLSVSARRGGPGVLPDKHHVQDRSYPIWRNLLFVTNGRPTGEVKRFLDFVRSPEGQRIVEEVGYYRLPTKD